MIKIRRNAENVQCLILGPVLSVTLGDLMMTCHQMRCIYHLYPKTAALYTVLQLSFGSEESKRPCDSILNKEESCNKAMLLLFLTGTRKCLNKKTRAWVVCEGVDQNWENSDCFGNPHQAIIPRLVRLVKSCGLPIFVDSLAYCWGRF